MKSPQDLIRVYSPEPLLGHPVVLVRSIARDLLAARELAWRLFVRDLSAQYRQTFLGYIWVFLPPLAASLTFIFLNSQGIVRIVLGRERSEMKEVGRLKHGSFFGEMAIISPRGR